MVKTGGRTASQLQDDHSAPKKGVSTYIPETCSCGDNSGTDKSPSRSNITKSRPVDEAIQAAMKRSEKDLQHELGFFHCPEQADFQDRITINKYTFSTYRASESHGVIFFQAGDATLVPGKVRSIFLVKQDSSTHIFLAVHRFLTPEPSLPNPFARYPEFGASLWSSETQKEVTIVPGSRKIYHAIYRDWEFKIMVMKPLNRVSNFYYLRWKMADLRTLGLLSWVNIVSHHYDGFVSGVPGFELIFGHVCVCCVLS